MASIVYETDNCASTPVHTRPRAISLAMITMRKLTHGFPFLSSMGMGLRLAAPRAAGVLLKTIEKDLIGTLITGRSTAFISTLFSTSFIRGAVGRQNAYHLLITHKMLAALVTFSGWWFQCPRYSISRKYCSNKPTCHTF